MLNLIGIRELRENTAEYVKKIKKGQSFIVLKRSKPLFKIVPLDKKEKEDAKWETVIDFTKFKKNGIPADELLEILSNLD